ncbi:hypothetical protein L1049_025752 [Liquidambar formosana]|uniref:E2F/DP family winged-helix DNA-binding domain-containing protein n=1 Tax=Liquidambar formosana TaxID=63359 RepID=A0AAP0R353_LIQFO
MSNSGEDPSRSHQQSRFQYQLLSQHQTQNQSLNRLFPSSFRRPHTFFFASPSNHFSDVRPDFHGGDRHSASAKIQTNETENREAQSTGQATLRDHTEAVATLLEHTEAVNNPPLGPDSSTGGGMHHSRKSKVSKHTKSGTQRSNAEFPNVLNSANNCRYDSSLGLLTKKFISLIQEAKDGTLDLNNTADVLEVQKRRIYDITNVLEGIGLIEKTSKNHIQWKGFGMLGPKELDDEVSRLKAGIEGLYAQECRLDECIREKQELLRALDDDENCRKYLYLTEEDIMSLPCFQNQTLIAVKAPQASYVEVPDPDEDISFPERQFRIIIRSTTGPIDLYLLSKHEGPYKDINVKEAKPIDPSAWHNGAYRVENAGQSLECHQDNQKISPGTFSSLGLRVPGIQKIIPSDSHIDDDYWFHSDPEVSITDLWANEEWAQVDDLEVNSAMNGATLVQPQASPRNAAHKLDKNQVIGCSQ